MNEMMGSVQYVGEVSVPLWMQRLYQSVSLSLQDQSCTIKKRYEEMNNF